MIDFDMMIVHVGEFGKYQKFLFVFQAPFCLFVTFVLFGQLFMTNYPQNYWCRDYVDLNCYNLTDIQRQNLSFPLREPERREYNFHQKYITENENINCSLIAINRRAIASCSSNLTTLCSCTFSITPECVHLTPQNSISQTIVRRKRYGNYYNRWNNPQLYQRPPATTTTTTTPSTRTRPTTTTTEDYQEATVSEEEFERERIQALNPGGDYWNNPPIYDVTTTTRPITTTRRSTTRSTVKSTIRSTIRSTTKSTTSRNGIISTTRINVNPDLNDPNIENTFENARLDSAFADCQTRNFPTPEVIGIRDRWFYRRLDERNSRRQVCSIPKVDLSRWSIPNSTIFETISSNGWKIEGTKCTNWGFDPNHMDAPYVTIVTHWNSDWFLDPEMRNTISQAVFFVGAICGGFLIGYIADKHGRVPALITANMFGCIGGALSAAPFAIVYFPLFCFFRFITGFAFDNSFTMMYILVLEYVGPTYRTMVANLSIAVFFTLGTIILPWLAVLVMDWQIYALLISLPMILSLLSIWLVPESARWLLSKGRTAEATIILRQFAKVNGRKVEEKIFVEFEEGAEALYKEISQEKEESLMDGLKRPKILKNFVLLTIIWSMIALCYDGHSRNVLNFSVLDIFYRFTIASMTEFPADILLILTLDRAGRRFLAFSSLVLSGVFSLISALVPETPDLVVPLFALTMVSRFFVNVSFNIGLQYAAELLPTVIRAQGVNAIHIMGYVAQIISPYIASIGRTNRPLSLILLAIFAIIGGVLSLFLPETLGEDLANNLEEGEAFGKNQSFFSCPLWSKKRDLDEEDVLPTAPKVTLRNSMRPSMRGETFRSSIISHGSTGSGHLNVLRRNRRVDLDPGTGTEKKPLFRNTR